MSRELKAPVRAASWVPFLLLAVVLDGAGAAGYRYGFGVVAVALFLAAAAPLVVVLRRSRYLPAALILAAVAAIGVGGLLLDRAPYSAPRLAAQLDEIEPPLYEVIEERRTGTSRCRPTCPTVTRIYSGPLLGRRGTILEWVSSLHRARFDVDIETAVAEADSFRATKDAVVGHVAVLPAEEDDVSSRISVRLASSR